MYVVEPYGFIYITTNLINGKRYIGQKKFDDRSRWKSYLGSGLHLQNAIKKYKKENFVRDIVDIGYNSDELNEKEKHWIEDSLAISRDDYYNQIDGGNVLAGLKKKNSIPCVCIDSGKVFETLTDASIASGTSIQYVKDSFDVKHSYEYINENVIFRKLEDITNIDKICPMCGEEDKELIQNGILRKRCVGCEKKFKGQIRRKKLSKKDLMPLYKKEINSLIVEFYTKGLTPSKIADLINMSGFGDTYVRNFLVSNDLYNKNRGNYYYAVFDKEDNFIKSFLHKNDLINWTSDNASVNTKSFYEIYKIINFSIIKEESLNDYKFKLVNSVEYKSLKLSNT